MFTETKPTIKWHFYTEFPVKIIGPEQAVDNQNQPAFCFMTLRSQVLQPRKFLCRLLDTTSLETVLLRMTLCQRSSDRRRQRKIESPKSALKKDERPATKCRTGPYIHSCISLHLSSFTPSSTWIPLLHSLRRKSPSKKKASGTTVVHRRWSLKKVCNDTVY